MASTVKWSEINDDDLNSDEMQGFVVTRGDTKTVTTFADSSEGTVKIVIRSTIHRRNVRVSRTTQAIVETLRNNAPTSSEEHTSLCEKTFMEVPFHGRKVEDDQDEFDDYSNKEISGALPVLRRDTVKKKFQQIRLFASGNQLPENAADFMNKPSDEKEEAEPLDPKYVSARARVTQKDDCTVRVTNLSEETKESDLEELFGCIGKISRIYLAKDKETKSSKGFAFITYEDRRGAEKAIRTLDRHGYDSLLLKVEWAKPSTKVREAF